MKQVDLHVRQWLNEVEILKDGRFYNSSILGEEGVLCCFRYRTGSRYINLLLIFNITVLTIFYFCSLKECRFFPMLADSGPSLRNTKWQSSTQHQPPSGLS